MPSSRYYRPRADKPIKVTCAACNQRTLHTILFAVDISEEDDSVHTEHNYQTLECRGCEKVSFRTNWISSEDEYPDDDGVHFVPYDHETLYPSRIAGAAPLADAYLLPPALNRIYEETHAALSANLPILAGIGIRAIVESLCTDRQARGPNLAVRIDALVTQGVMTTAGATILHSLRHMGNTAAHEVMPHKPEDLLTAMRVVEHALQGVYILPRHAERLPPAP
ncbi:MAG: DUF4145 domain-containing protein [Gemmatimonadetes bacterium]|nr:DUF4145 domain-containing protein [Gemmatimonadota bacterium]